MGSAPPPSIFGSSSSGSLSAAPEWDSVRSCATSILPFRTSGYINELCDILTESGVEEVSQFKLLTPEIIRSNLHKRGKEQVDDIITLHSRVTGKEKPSLWAAAEDRDVVKCMKLLDERADPSETYKSWTPLMKAAEEDNATIIQLLMEKGADLNAVNSKGRSALSFAAAPSMKRPTAANALRFLLEQGADMSLKDDSGFTAKDRAQREKRNDALEILAVHTALR